VCAFCVVAVARSATGAERAGSTGSVSPALEVYALEMELAEARRRVASLAAELDRATAERAAARRQLRLGRRMVAASQHRLARLVHRLYAAGEPEPLAVLLGAESFDDAERSLDALRRAAAQSRAVGEQARQARAETARLVRELNARTRSLAGLEAEARRTAERLAAALERRRAYLAELARRESAARAAAVRQQAAAATRRSAELTAAARPRVVAVADAAPAAEEPSIALRSVRRLTVDAVAYSLPGHTASGLHVGRGVVAVDPSVIPLGTRFYVPGYGPGVAADVGTAVKGLLIDLWFPTRAEAAAWGRRTVTITLL
jgi:3D (Asp-Asp-Asp) domain-containing protein